MIPIKPKLLRILEAQCEGIISIPSLDFLTGTNSLFCGLPSPIFFEIFEDNNLAGLAFSPDGKTMFVPGAQKDRIYQYNVPTAFSMDSGVLFDSLLDVSPEDTSPRDITFSPNGLKMFIAGGNSDDIFQYALTTPFVIDSGVSLEFTFDLLPLVIDATGIFFSPDGTRMFVVDLSGTDKIYQFNLSNPFDLSSGVTQPKEFLLSGQLTNPTDVAFNTDGTRMFITEITTDLVFQYDLPSGFELTGVQFNGVSFDPQELLTSNIAFNTDGSRMFLFFANNPNINLIKQYDLSTNFDISTAIFNGVRFTPQKNSSDSAGIFFTPDGTKMFLLNSSTNNLNKYNLDIPFDLSTGISLVTSFPLGGTNSTFPSGITFSNNGLKMYVSSLVPNRDILEYTLNDPFDLTNPPAGAPAKFNVFNEVNFPRGVVFDDTGDKMFVADDDSGSIVEYNVPTAFDITSGLTENTTFAIPGPGGTPTGLAFSPDGKTLFLTDVGSDANILQLSLSIAFDLTSVVTLKTFLTVVDLDNFPAGIILSNDGKRLFFTGNASDGIFQIFLKKPFELP